jgi:hypothetical protein
MRLMNSLLLLAIIFLLGSCSTNENPVEPGPVTETMKLTVDASETYYIKFSQKSEVAVTDPLLEDGWDIVVDNLTRIRLNGGSTAPGTVYAVVLPGAVYDNIATAPDMEYVTDTQNGDVIGEDWYTYNVTNHTVNPKDQIYVIRTEDGAFYKFMITATAFTSMSAGELNFRFDPVGAPANASYQNSSGLIKLAKFTLSGSGRTYFSLKSGSEISVSDPSVSTAWDIASDFVTIFTNGGTSGPGQGAVVLLTSTEFDSVAVAPQNGYASDDSTATPDPVRALGDSWYTYNVNTHSLTVNPGYIYVLRTAEGKYAKLEFVAADFSGMTGGVAVVRLEYLDSGMNF